MNAETVFDNDDPVRHRILVSPEEAEGMSENEWLELKNCLQGFLIRKEHEEQPAYPQEVAYDWFELYAKVFDQFYEEMKLRNPTTLVAWWKEIADDDEINDIDFLQKWVQFKNKTQSA